jgi:hypothetical protein
MLSEILNIIERTALREFAGDFVGIIAFALIVIFGFLSVGVAQ